MYLAFFSIGMSSTVWSVNTEIYPIHLISTATALATFSNWFSNFVVSSSFLTLMGLKPYGKEIAFVLLAFFCLSAWIFIYFLVPETNGRPITVNVKNVLTGNVFGDYQVQEDEVREDGLLT